MAIRKTPIHGGGEVQVWQPGESGNPNGRPRKLVSHINKQLKEQGVEPVSDAQVKELLLLTFNLDEEDIKELAKDKSVPIVLRLMLRDIVSGDTARMRDFLFDRAFGKASQKTEHSGPGGSPLFPESAEAISDAAMKKIVAALKNEKTDG